MKLYAICDNEEALTGLRLAGVEGTWVQDDKDFDPAFDRVLADETIGVVLVSPSLMARHAKAIDELRFHRATPLVTALKGPGDKDQTDPSIADAIQRALGISV